MDQWSVRVEYQGNEREPVVVINNFAARPLQFIEDAVMLHFTRMGEHYPGVRANVARGMLTPLLTALRDMIRTIFDCHEPEISDAFYSLVTTPPQALGVIQRLPHFDGVEPQRLALLHYLSSDQPGGTAFYRHRATGMETVTAARLPEYRAALKVDLQRAGIPEAAYIDGDTELFECIARYEGVFNRAILYRGNTLHCAWLPDARGLINDPASGRLTLNAFLR